MQNLSNLFQFLTIYQIPILNKAMILVFIIALLRNHFNNAPQIQKTNKLKKKNMVDQQKMFYEINRIIGTS